MAVAAKFPPAGLVGTRRAAAKPMATDITDEDHDDIAFGGAVHDA